MVPGRRDLGGTGAVDQGNGEIAEGSHNLWSGAGSQAGAVFLEADIAHRMGYGKDSYRIEPRKVLEHTWPELSAQILAVRHGGKQNVEDSPRSCFSLSPSLF